MTRTQLVETKNGAIKYRDLKDVVEIVLDKSANRSSSGGSDYTLKLKFADGDCYEYLFERWWTEHLSEAEQWREKATVWRDEAVSAAKRGDGCVFRFTRHCSKIVDDKHDGSKKRAAQNFIKNYTRAIRCGCSCLFSIQIK